MKYGYSVIQQNTKNVLKNIKNEKRLKRANKLLLKEYAEYLEHEKLLRNNRIYKILISLKLIGILLGKSFKSATKEDFLRVRTKLLDGELNFDRHGVQKPRSEVTVHDYYVILRSFMKWYYVKYRGFDEYETPNCIKFEKMKVKNRITRQVEDITTQEELKKIIENETNPMAKAMLCAYFATGGRLSEVLRLRFKDVKDYGNYVMLNFWVSKTEPREVEMYFGGEHVLHWKGMHPEPSADAPFFVGTVKGLSEKQPCPSCKSEKVRRTARGLWKCLKCEHKFKVESRPRPQLSYMHATRIIKNAYKRAGVNRRATATNIRASYIVFCIEMNVPLLKIQKNVGQKIGGSTIQYYAKLSKKTTSSVASLLRGEEDTKPKAIVKDIACPRCSKKTMNTNRFCSHCGFALSPEAIEIIEKATKETNEKSMLVSKASALGDKNAKLKVLKHYSLD